IIALSSRVYREEVPYTASQLSGQISAFPEGCFVAEYEGEVVGYAASSLLREARVMRPHTYDEISGGGYGSQHNGNGDWLYGLEVMVDPARRRLRLGQRLYRARERLATDLGLKGIAFGGRLAGFRRLRKEYPTPEDYVEAVRDRRLKDPTLSFQLDHGFELIRALPRYAPEDLPAGGHAALMVWRNPAYAEAFEGQPLTRTDPTSVRVASVQMEARRLASTDAFYDAVDYFVKIAADYGADFVTFPEYFSLQLLSPEPLRSPPEAIQRMTEHTAEFRERLSAMAIARNINIIGGTHPTQTEDGDIQNVAYVFLRDGSVHAQEKMHATPDERTAWAIAGGDIVAPIETDCGPIGVAICYDSEFPELVRRLADSGALILFVPYNTDTRHGHLRVKYCCQARAIENQMYVVTAGMTGNLANVSNIDIQYAQSAILTPCDFPFARDGIAAEASENVEMITVADLDLKQLRWARAQGSVRNLRDRRFDLYRTRWSDGG
ncbi:MAG: carbon-nitrogen hydrolase family protein, partial [Shimia sp.]